MDKNDVYKSNVDSLARMMDLDQGDQGLWNAGELGEILKHQLAATIEFDFTYIGAESVDRLSDLAAKEGPPIETFGDLFQHPHPPVELLKMTKDFARSCRGRSGGAMPDEIATLLYTLSIVVALAKCQCRITGLDNEGLSHCLDWALGQSWLDDSTRQLLKQCSPAVDRPAT